MSEDSQYDPGARRASAMDEADFLDRTRRVAEAFRPAAPIDRRDLFAGPRPADRRPFGVVSQPGQHAVVYGERGVGKTSLGLVVAELLRGSDVREPLSRILHKPCTTATLGAGRMAVRANERRRERALSVPISAAAA